MSEQPVFGDRYRLLWYPAKEGRIGEVRNYTTNRMGFRLVPVMLDDELMQRISMRYLATSWNNLGPQIIASRAFTTLPQNFKDAGIWHEMGHVHHEHHLRADFEDQAQLRAARIAAVKEKRVILLETEADMFAVSRAGKEKFIGFLTHVLETRPLGGTLSWNDLGRRELELRIKAIQAL